MSNDNKVWKQVVLFVTGNTYTRLNNIKAFGEQSKCLFIETMSGAVELVEIESPDVLVFDSLLLPIDRYDALDTFNHFYKRTFQINPRINFIVLISSKSEVFEDLSHESGHLIFLKGRATNANQLAFISKVLRQRVFRPILNSDLDTGSVFPCDLYHYLPLNKKYSIFINKNTPFDEKKKEALARSKIMHLYVKQSDLYTLLDNARSFNPNGLPKSEMLLDARNLYRKILIQIFNCITDYQETFGKIIHGNIAKLIKILEKLINSYSDKHLALMELPAPRAGGLNHGLNCAIYAIIFGQHLSLKNVHELAFVALLHNIGLSEIDKDLLERPYPSLTPDELQEYSLHISSSIEITKRKKIPLTSRMETMISQHHENYDGSGIPNGISHEALLYESSLISIVGCFDYFNAIIHGREARSSLKSWEKVKEFHYGTNKKGTTFNPQLVSKLESFFHG